MWLSEREKLHKFKCLQKRFLEIVGHIDERGMGRFDTYRTYRKQKKKKRKGKESNHVTDAFIWKYGRTVSGS